MADYGLSVRNSQNELQIDSTYQNLAFRSKGSVVANAGTGFSSWANGTAYLPYSPTGVVAWRADGPACLYTCVPEGGSLRVTWGTYTAGRGPVTVWWYLFDVPTIVGIPPGPHYGLRVKDASGVTTYHSAIPYMTYAALIKGTDSDIPTTQENNNPVERSYFIGNGIVPAVIQSNMSTFTTEVAIGVGPGVYFMMFGGEVCVRQVDGALNLSNPVRSAGPYNQSMGVPTIRRPGWGYMVVDVSKL